MAKKSRDKGARFERRVAGLFAKAFNRNIRRTPSLLHRNPDKVVGKQIRSDLYDPDDNDTFPYFVECKFHETFSFNQLMLDNTKLYSFVNRAERDAEAHEKGKIPIVVFKGGHFLDEMVVFKDDRWYHIFRGKNTPPFFFVRSGKHAIVRLSEFLKLCFKEYKTVLHEEDDGYQD